MSCNSVDRAENLMTTGARHLISSVSSLPQVRLDLVMHVHTNNVNYVLKTNNSYNNDNLQENSATHVSYESGDNVSKWRPKPVPVSQKTSVSGVFSSLNEYLNSGRSTSTASVSDNSHGDHCTIDEPENEDPELPAWSQPKNDVISLEEKPDLIDSTVICPIVSVVSNETDVVEERHSSHGTFLPDIATAGTFGNTVTNDDASSSLDLLSHKSNTIGVDTVSSEEAMTEFQPTNSVLGFGTFDVNQEIDDDELNEYLSDLELEEKEQEENLILGASTDSSLLVNDKSEIESNLLKLTVVEDVSKETQHDNPCLHPDSVLLNEPSLNMAGSLEAEQPQTVEKYSSIESPTQAETSSSPINNFDNFTQEQKNEHPHGWSEPAVFESTEGTHWALASEASLKQSEEVSEEINEISGSPQSNLSEISTNQRTLSHTSAMEEPLTCLDEIVSHESFSTPSCQLASGDINPAHVLPSDKNSAEIDDKSNTANVQDGDGVSKLGTRLELQQDVMVPLTLCLNQSSDLSSKLSSPPTPPTVPVTPTLQDTPVFEEIASNLSTPFLTPTAVCESPVYNENNGLEESVSNLPNSSTSDVEAHPETVTCDQSQKPVRPSSLEIPVCTEPAQAETTGSSDESPAALNATVGKKRFGLK